MLTNQLQQPNSTIPRGTQQAVALALKQYMLHVWSISGKELAAVVIDELSDVRTLKHRLRSQYGYPICIQQLMHSGACLDDDAKLAHPVDLQLVLLQLPGAVEDQASNVADELVTYAASQGHVETLRLMLGAGANANLADDDSCTALISSSVQGHTEIARLLLEAAADPDTSDHHVPNNRFDRYTCSALGRASQHGHVGIVRLLLAARAQTYDAAYRYGECNSTPLLLACHNGHVEIARLLIEATLEWDIIDLQGRAARFCVSEDGWIEELPIQPTPLIAASSRGHVELVQLLLESGANLNVPDVNKRTALSYASEKGHVEVVRLLLSAGARRDLVDRDGKSAFAFASAPGHLEIRRLLVEASGRELSGRDKHREGEGCDRKADANSVIHMLAMKFPKIKRLGGFNMN